LIAAATSLPLIGEPEPQNVMNACRDTEKAILRAVSRGVSNAKSNSLAAK